MKKIWDKIEKKLAEIAPEILKDLNNGVTESDIEKLEKTIGTKLPNDFKDFYKLHNGQNNSAGLIESEELLSFDRIIDEWSVWKGLLDKKSFEKSGVPFESDADEGIKNIWWNKFWIPFTYDGSGNHYCIDLDPDKGGKVGQVIRMWHDDSERTLIADSFKEFISGYADDLSNGLMVYSEEYNGIVYDEDFDD